MNLNKLRNRILNSTINVLTKARAKPGTFDDILDNSELNDDQKVAAIVKRFHDEVAITLLPTKDNA
jgi:hypothetical protein